MGQFELLRRNKPLLATASVLTVALAIATALATQIANEHVILRLQLSDGRFLEQIEGENTYVGRSDDGREIPQLARYRRLEISTPGRPAVIRESVAFPTADFFEQRTIAYGDTPTFYVLAYDAGDDLRFRARPIRTTPILTTQPKPAIDNQWSTTRAAWTGFDKKLPAGTESVEISNTAEGLLLECKPVGKQILCTYDAAKDVFSFWEHLK